jgi:hypothetical protein
MLRFGPGRLSHGTSDRLSPSSVRRVLCVFRADRTACGLSMAKAAVQ